ELVAELDGGKPTDADNVQAELFVVGRQDAYPTRQIHDFGELVARDLELSEGERTTNPHLVPRLLIVRGLLVVIRGAHPELARGDFHQLELGSQRRRLPARGRLALDLRHQLQ